MTLPIEIKEKKYTVKEWLELEKESDVRHEFYYGKRVSLNSGSKQANRLIANIFKLTDDAIYRKGIEAYTHDVVTEVMADHIYRYPDLVVAPISDDEDEYIVKQPVLMAEIASKKSSHRDKVKKRREYFEIETMKYYLIVSQDEMWVVLHTRGESGNWETQYLTEPEDIVDLKEFDLQMNLATIYKRVKLG